MKQTKKTKTVEDSVLMKMTLDEVLKKKGISGYKFAEKLGVKPHALTPTRKPGYNPKLTTLLKWCIQLDCDINELFEYEGYTPKHKKETKKD